jgi:hypothetical protein
MCLKLKVLAPEAQRPSLEAVPCSLPPAAHPLHVASQASYSRPAHLSDNNSR